MIAGVAGGIGRYIGVDPVVIRLTLIVLAFFGGAGVIAYIAAWIIVPRDDGSATEFGGGDIARRTGIALGILALTFVVAVGGAWGVAIGGGTATAIVVIGVGVALVVGAFTSGARWLILPALVLALSTATVAAADIDARGGTGERIYHPASVADMREEYKLGVGRLYLDLRDVEFGPGEQRVSLKVGMGQAEVIVPSDVCVSTVADISIGHTEVFEREAGGIDHDFDDRHAGDSSRPHLLIDADIGFGELRVQPSDVGRTAAAPGACDG